MQKELIHQNRRRIQIQINETRSVIADTSCFLYHFNSGIINCLNRSGLIRHVSDTNNHTDYSAKQMYVLALFAGKSQVI